MKPKNPLIIRSIIAMALIALILVGTALKWALLPGILLIILGLLVLDLDYKDAIENYKDDWYVTRALSAYLFCVEIGVPIVLIGWGLVSIFSTIINK